MKHLAAFRVGSLPSDRIQVPPSPQYTPRQPESKEEIKAGMQDIIARMRFIAPTLDDIPLENTIEHPGLGYLNAKE